MSSPSNWALSTIKFKKLDDLPKGKPHTSDAIMAAMRVLHRMIHAQAIAYGGKKSKLLPVGIAETSLLSQVSQLDEISTASVDDNLEAACMCCNRLQRHLASRDDAEGMELLLDVFNYVNSSLAEAHGKLI